MQKGPLLDVPVAGIYLSRLITPSHSVGGQEWERKWRPTHTQKGSQSHDLASLIPRLHSFPFSKKKSGSNSLREVRHIRRKVHSFVELYAVILPRYMYTWRARRVAESLRSSLVKEPFGMKDKARG